jgi:hypothetical protein
MPTTIEINYAAGEKVIIEPGPSVGPHSRAANQIKTQCTKKETAMKTPRSSLGREKKPRCNVIKKNYDKNMQASVEQERGLYYRNEAGIDMSYPHGSKVANLKTLSIINNHSIDNSFNVIVGCKKGSEQKTTFIALKVSENRKKVAPDKRLIYEAALQGMLLTKPNVVRGSKRNGVVKQYVCHGYRKNPKDRDIGEYEFNKGTSEETKQEIKDGVNLLVQDMEQRGLAEMGAANLRVCAGYIDFFKLQDKFNLPSMVCFGIGTQFALSTWYTSRVHTDKDYFLTTLSVYDAEAGPDEVLYYFCFPTYNVAIPMRSGDILVFNPTVPHCATNPSRNTAKIYSCYVSKKTCNTVVANEKV